MANKALLVGCTPGRERGKNDMNLKERKEKFDANIADLCKLVLHYK
jgi:hypothetical protein